MWVLVGALWVGCLITGPAAALAAAGLLPLLASGGLGPRTRLALAGVLLVGVGAAGAGGRETLADSGPLATLAARGGEAEVRAVVATEPESSSAGTWAIVRVERLGASAVRTRAFLRLEGLEGAPDLGQTVEFRTTARPLDRDGFEGYLRRLHAGVALDARSPPRVVAPANSVLRATTVVRGRVRAAAGRHLGPDEAALLAGLVTGDTRGTSDERSAQFTAAGLSHLVAVSGSNVALVVGGVTGVLGAVGVGARSRRWAVGAAVVWFAVLVRAEPSVLRAAVMALLVLIAAAGGRGTGARHVLGSGVLLLLLVDPMLAGQLGFVLSVGATAGVLLLAPEMAARLPLPRPAALLVGASVGAQVGVAPVLITLPDGLPLASLPANLVAVPAAAVASAIGVTAALVAQFTIPGAGVLAVLAWPALRVVLWSGEFFARGPRLEAADLATPVAVLLLAALLLRRRAPRLAVVAVVGVTLAAGFPHVRPEPEVTGLSVTALDVGQGDAILVEAPAGGGRPAGRMLVDGGPDPGAALDALRDRGIRRLDAIALSHPHADHSEGLPAVLAGLEVGAVLVGPQPLVPDVALSAAETHAAAGDHSVPVVAVADGHRMALGAAEVEVLGPPADGALGDDANENSLILRIEAGGAVALLTGDAEEEAQRRLLRLHRDRLAADVLKVPHHGAATNADGFLAAVGAGTALISVGADNEYGHPAPETLRDLGAAGVVRTDEHGTVGVPAARVLRRCGPRVRTPRPQRPHRPGRPTRPATTWVRTASRLPTSVNVLRHRDLEERPWQQA